MPIMTPGMTPLPGMPEAQHTPHTTHRPATMGGAPPQRPRSWIVLGAVAFVAIAAVTAVLARSPSTPAPTAASAMPAATSFRLVIDSTTPSGADVREGARFHGKTPVEITIENDSVQAAPRVFVVQADGYEPRTLTQGASRETVRHAIELHAVAAAVPSTTTSATTEKPKPVAKTVAKPVQSAASPPPKTDIILER
jgi:hypothetical protein